MTSRLKPYITKEVPFKFRGIDFTFALSQGLFSSAGVDRGSGFLLRILSKCWDEDIARGHALPRSVLDAGCGTGVLGICAAAYLKRTAGELCVRAQDRDELARKFTEYNAEKNGVPPSVLEAHTEALLSGPGGWDLILTNIPAKAGPPVLEDFVRRSLTRLGEGGRVLMVAVNTLADFFRSRIRGFGGEIFREETGGEHTVFGYRGQGAREEGTFPENPAYIRSRGDYELEGISCHIDAVYGAPGFNAPGGAVSTAAKLFRRHGGKWLEPETPVLIHEPGQGFFPVWLAEFLKQFPEFFPPSLVLSGRNILGLEAARRNTAAALRGNPAGAAASTSGRAADTGLLRVIPAADPFTDHEKLAAAEISEPGYGFIAAFPEPVPEADLRSVYWEGFARLLREKGCVLIALPSSEAERFDRKKPGGFIRLGDIKRDGFRAMIYRLIRLEHTPLFR
jgi:SAM-dependent methyltransferase